MLVKLYKLDNDILNYWEIWDTDAGLIVHWGKLGDTGESKTIEVKRGKTTGIANEQIKCKINEGYFELDRDSLEELIIQFEEQQNSEDLDFREAVQDIINQALGWTGNGHSTDADIGNGTINIFATVIDPYIACNTIHNTIKDIYIYKDFIIALKKQSDFVILYPENSIGDFTY